MDLNKGMFVVLNKITGKLVDTCVGHGDDRLQMVVHSTRASALRVMANMYEIEPDEEFEVVKVELTDVTGRLSFIGKDA